MKIQILGGKVGLRCKGKTKNSNLSCVMNSEFYFSVFMLFLALGKAKGPVESPTVKPFLNITPPPKTESLDSPEAGELTFNPS